MIGEKIYILLPVHNRRETTKRFIHCLTAQNYRNYHLILVDDGSTDGTSDMVSSYVPTCTLLKGDGSLWWAGALEKGYDWLKGNTTVSPTDIVLIINDDVEFDDHFLETASSILAGKNRTLLLAESHDRVTGRLLDRGINVDWNRLTFSQANCADDINCLSTRGLFLRIADLFEIGRFHPIMLPHYESDYEYTIRAHRKGYTLSTDQRLQISVHDAERSEIVENAYLRDDFISRSFAKGNTQNPLAWTSFIILACPWKFKMKNIMTIWIGFIIKCCINVLKKNERTARRRIVKAICRSLAAPLDCQVRRKRLRRQIKVKQGEGGIRIVLGSSNHSQDGWIATNIDELNIVRRKDWSRYFEQDSIDVLLAEHVWEHLDVGQAHIAAENCYRYLKRGGYIRLAVPDGYHPDESYIEAVKPCCAAQNVGHKALYTYADIAEMFRGVGFDVKLLEYFDENRVFHYSEWNSEQGMVRRSFRYDSRNGNGAPNYTSIVLDAVK